jgi:hypothetical protein
MLKFQDHKLKKNTLEHKGKAQYYSLSKRVFPVGWEIFLRPTQSKSIRNFTQIYNCDTTWNEHLYLFIFGFLQISAP